jgi:hypothetical protein
MLKISPQNSKTQGLREVPALEGYLANRRKIYSLDLLSGHTCPGAKDCLAKVVESGGKFILQDGPATLFRCFSASQEICYPNVRRARTHNLGVIKRLKSAMQIRDAILESLPRNLGVLRYHVGGDFFKLAYFQAAVMVAETMPDRLFYAYTKSLHHLAKLDCMDLSQGMIRQNFLVTTSRGGKYDRLIEPLNVRTATVVFTEAQAGDMPIDHDDSHAATVGGSFALLLHGVQPKGSEASKALVQLRGKGSYGKRR